MEEIKFYTTNKILENTGFEKPVIEKDQYHKDDGQLGAQEILMPGGHGWFPYLPALERQNQYFETMHCTVFNTLNPIESLAKLHWNEDWNKSERYIGVLAGISMNGGSPHNVAEAIRKSGLIEQSSLPWTPDLNTFNKYSSPRPMTEQYLKEGREWTRRYNFGHDWVVTYGKSVLATAIGQVGEYFNLISTPEAIKDALQYSPLGISVLAWQFDATGKAYKNRYATDNHWTVLYDYIEGDCWLIYDSYLKCHVKLQWNYPISFAKRYTLSKTNIDEIDAEYIKKTYYFKNVKGEKEAGIYLIHNDKKHPYPNTEEYNSICDRYLGSRDFIIVSQTALDLVEEGTPMLMENIKNAEPFNTIQESLNK